MEPKSPKNFAAPARSAVQSRASHAGARPDDLAMHFVEALARYCARQAFQNAQRPASGEPDPENEDETTPRGE